MKLVIWNILTCLLSAVSGKKFSVPAPGETPWFQDAKDDLKTTLGKREIIGRAKNVILFIGDGMDYQTINAARIYAGQRLNGKGEGNLLAFEHLPFTGTSKTYSETSMVPESAATATALLTGIKVNACTLGVNHNITHNVCGDEKAEAIRNLLEMSHDAGKSTGIVTTARLTHATPGACYAHTASRDWEDDREILSATNCDNAAICPCVDIARQLIEEHPYINVLLGGGRKHFLPSTTGDPEYPDQTGNREKGNLVEAWRAEKAHRQVSHQSVWNTAGFDAVDAVNTDYLLGLFEPDHMLYNYERKSHVIGEPSLAEMTHKAIEILQKDRDGFFLMVEGARIDHAHHAGQAEIALQETVAFDDAIAMALSMTNSEDTLIIVTADHSHSLTGGGGASRGNDIVGIDDGIAEDAQNLPRTTLAYDNGPGRNTDFSRRNLKDYDTSATDFVFDSLYFSEHASHSGFDVPVYALGPFAHLVTGVHEQNYFAHVMAYALCVGQAEGFLTYCDNK